jgi:hypothetical protein|tara:strand:+ start:97 stop:615 length:519 start_codon:yes stop_codon:yes gene_type:complete
LRTNNQHNENRTILILKNILILFILGWFNPAFSQLHHQMISSQGSTSETVSGIIVTQSIGQTSVVGNYSNTLIKINQGYQQPYWDGLVLSNTPDFTVSIFPNPFDNIINIRHNSEVDFEFFLFDVAGKLVFNNTFKVSSPQQTINLGILSSGVYFAKLQSNQLNYFTKLIKE